MKTTAKTMFGLLLIAASINVSAQNNHLNNNKMTNFKSGTNEVTFKSQGVKLAGLLFTPDNFDESKKYSAVVFSGPFNQVKEQMGAVYGKKFAAQGYVFLSYDPYSFGDSEGEPRNNEHAQHKMESIRDAISYLGTLSFVDRDKLFGLGGCASGGYMPLVATTDKRLKAIATVSGMMDNQASYFGVMTKEQLVPLFTMANDARQKAYETGETDYYDALGMNTLDLENLDKSSAQYEGYDYYMTKRAGKETYPNYTHMAPMTLMENAPLTSAIAYAPYLYTPYLGIIGEKAETGVLTELFYEKCSEPKELYKVPGATHVSLYDIDKDVDRAVAKMDEFFKKYSK
ncbi:MAG: alpha/beta hydrolase [Cytophagales bacterium]|nr:alpha/beta hydrolase [Cytophagales bacterium]